MHFYDTLAKYQKMKAYRKSEDFYFYLENRHLFNGVEMYKFLLNANNEFDVIRANIIIRAIMNKKLLDEAIVYAFTKSKMKSEEIIEFIHERMTGLPYIAENDMKIYVPIFPRSINQIYYTNFGKLLKAPYNKLIETYETSCIDLFEMYNFALYNSLFTKFITIYQDQNLIVLYHFDFQTVYIVNDQGRLDEKIALFDKYLRHPHTNHIVERLKTVIKAYLADDREAFYEALVDNELISKKLIMKIKHSEYKALKAKKRKAR